MNILWGSYRMHIPLPSFSRYGAGRVEHWSLFCMWEWQWAWDHQGGNFREARKEANVVSLSHSDESRPWSVRKPSISLSPRKQQPRGGWGSEIHHRKTSYLVFLRFLSTCFFWTCWWDFYLMNLNTFIFFRASIFEVPKNSRLFMELYKDSICFILKSRALMEN